MASSDNPVKRRPMKTQQARDLRRSETDAEHVLWSELRNRLLNGHKFTRQAPLGPYIIDFLCRDRRLAVELDGSQHAGDERDARRTAWLNDNGYSVLRFWNDEVFRERRAVLETILAVLEGRLTERCEVTRFYPSTIVPGAPSPACRHPLPAGERGYAAPSPLVPSTQRGEGGGSRMRGPHGTTSEQSVK